MEPLLRVHTSVLDDVAVARLSGELDLTSAGSLLARLQPAVDLAGRVVVVDMHGLTFVDCAGLSALVEARTGIARHGIELVLAAPTGPVSRLLSLTGTRRIIPIFSTVRLAINRYHVTTPVVPRPATGSPSTRAPRRRPARLVRPAPIAPLPDASGRAGPRP